MNQQENERENSPFAAYTFQPPIELQSAQKSRSAHQINPSSFRIKRFHLKKDPNLETNRIQLVVFAAQLPFESELPVIITARPTIIKAQTLRYSGGCSDLTAKRSGMLS